MNILEEKIGGRISYLPVEGRPVELLSLDAALGIETVPETAFIVDGEERMAILKGDWREACKDCNTMEECMKVFWDNVDKATDSSQHMYFKDQPTRN